MRARLLAAALMMAMAGGLARPGSGAGQDLRAQALALGAADASAAEGAGGVGRLGREGIRRQHQVQGVSRPAARQGVRPLRHGARRHRRPHLHQSRLPAWPLPDHRRGRAAVPDFQRQGRLAGARCLVSQVRGSRDEGREILPRLRPRSGLVPLQGQEDHGAGRHQGHEDPPRARDHGDVRDPARRHQRAVERARGARHPGEGRRRCRDLPVGFGAAVRHRQGHQVPHGRAALRHHLRLRLQQGVSTGRCRRRRRR